MRKTTVNCQRELNSGYKRSMPNIITHASKATWYNEIRSHLNSEEKKTTRQPTLESPTEKVPFLSIRLILSYVATVGQAILARLPNPTVRTVSPTNQAKPLSNERS